MVDTFFWQGFFYPFFLSRFYYFIGSSVVAAKIFGAALGSVTCVLVYFLGRGFLSRRTSIIAALITVFYGPLIFFETELLATGWAGFWSVVIILLLQRCDKARKELLLYILTGLCAGLAIITRGFFIVFIAAAGLWLISKICLGIPNHLQAAIRIVLFVSAVLIVPIIVGCVSYIERGLFTTLPQAGAMNLYVGNNPDSERTVALRPGRQWNEIFTSPEMVDIENKDEYPASFLRQFSDYVKSEPGDYIKGLLHKAVQFTSSREIPRNFDVYLNRKYSSILSVLTFKIGKFGFPFGLLLPFAVMGLVFDIKRIPVPILLFLLLYPLAVILVFVCARYRVPIIPVLALPAALGIRKVLELLRRGRFAKLFLLISIVAGIAAASSLAGPFESERFNYEAEMYFLIAYPAYQNGDIERADKLLTEAIELKSDYADAYILRGTMYSQTDQPQRAVEYLSKGVEFAPDFYIGRYRLAENLIKLGKSTFAAEQLRTALKQSSQKKNSYMSARIVNLLYRINEPNQPQP